MGSTHHLPMPSFGREHCCCSVKLSALSNFRARSLDSGVPAMGVVCSSSSRWTPLPGRQKRLWSRCGACASLRVLHRKPEAAERSCSFRLRGILNRFSSLSWPRVAMDARARAKRYEKLDFLGEGQVRNSGLICLLMCFYL